MWLIPERKKKLAELCADQVQIHQSAAFLAFCADLHRDWMANQMHGVERFDGDYVEALMIATVDVALMMQNVAIAAESMGLGICMIGAMRNNPKAVGELLGLPPYVVAVSGFCIGYPAQEPEVKPRLPVDAVLHRERYLDDETHRDDYEGLRSEDGGILCVTGDAQRRSALDNGGGRAHRAISCA